MRDPRVRRWMRIAAAPSRRAADAEWTRFLEPGDKAALLRPELRTGGPDLEPLLISDQLEASCRCALDRRLAYDIRGRLAEALLLKHEKVAMQRALEVRLPFLDRGVIELAQRLPARLKVHRGREKVVLSELARRHLPPEIAARRKQALAYPRRSWSRPPAGDRLREILLDGCGRGPFLRDPLERFLSRPPAPLDHDRPFAALVTLQVWWNEFF
jgi:asparagine synthase (glutamine-hydrolysing)